MKNKRGTACGAFSVFGRGRRILNPSSLREEFKPHQERREEEVTGGLHASSQAPTSYQNKKHADGVPFVLAGAGGFEPATHGFGDRYSTS